MSLTGRPTARLRRRRVRGAARRCEESVVHLDYRLAGVDVPACGCAFETAEDQDRVAAMTEREFDAYLQAGKYPTTVVCVDCLSCGNCCDCMDEWEAVDGVTEVFH